MLGKSLSERVAWFESELSYALGPESPYIDPTDWFKANPGELLNLLHVLRDIMDDDVV